jgi:hypothetical protein
MHLDHRLLVIWVGAMVREHARATNDNPFYTLPYGITNKLKVRSPLGIWHLIYMQDFRH